MFDHECDPHFETAGEHDDASEEHEEDVDLAAELLAGQREERW